MNNQDHDIRSRLKALANAAGLSLSDEHVDEILPFMKNAFAIRARARGLALSDIPPAFLFVPEADRAVDTTH